ncbi:MAG: hypothetical protein AAF108_07880 [Planctomycetota bacterium]
MFFVAACARSPSVVVLNRQGETIYGYIQAPRATPYHGFGWAKPISQASKAAFSVGPGETVDLSRVASNGMRFDSRRSSTSLVFRKASLDWRGVRFGGGWSQPVCIEVHDDPENDIGYVLINGRVEPLIAVDSPFDFLSDAAPPFLEWTTQRQ